MVDLVGVRTLDRLNVEGVDADALVDDPGGAPADGNKFFRRKLVVMQEKSAEFGFAGSTGTLMPPSVHCSETITRTFQAGDGK